MRINQAGLDLIKRFEGLSLKAYLCPANVLTIGYGSTGPHVKPGMVITEAEAEHMLQADLMRFELGVERLFPRTKLSDNEFSALVSFAFNLGVTALKNSTLTKKLLLGDRAGAADEFLKWTKAGGKVLKGLVLRREAERALFLS